MEAQDQTQAQGKRGCVEGMKTGNRPVMPVACGLLFWVLIQTQARVNEKARMKLTQPTREEKSRDGNPENASWLASTAATCEGKP